MNTVAQLLAPRDIRLDVCVQDRAQLFEEVGQRLEWVNGVPQKSVVASLFHREQIGSTALGQGIAIPHARVKELERIHLAYWRLVPPIDFDAPDGAPVSDVLIILVPRQATEDHLRILADASEMFSDSRFREELRACKDPMQAKELFDAWPRRLF